MSGSCTRTGTTDACFRVSQHCRMAEVKLSVPRDFRGPFVAELMRSTREAQLQGRHVDVFMHAGDGGQVSIHKVILLRNSTKVQD